jgi:hypothetical protein
MPARTGRTFGGAALGRAQVAPPGCVVGTARIRSRSFPREGGFAWAEGSGYHPTKVAHLGLADLLPPAVEGALRSGLAEGRSRPPACRLYGWCHLVESLLRPPTREHSPGDGFLSGRCGPRWQAAPLGRLRASRGGSLALVTRSGGSASRRRRRSSSLPDPQPQVGATLSRVARPGRRPPPARPPSLTLPGRTASRFLLPA